MIRLFKFHTPADGPGGVFRVDDSGPECYPEVQTQPVSQWGIPWAEVQERAEWIPISTEGFFNGVCTFNPKTERRCSDCDREIMSREWTFLFDDAEVCEGCAGIVWIGE